MSSLQNLAISIKVFFLCKFDEVNTNCCQFQCGGGGGGRGGGGEGGGEGGG